MNLNNSVSVKQTGSPTWSTAKLYNRSDGKSVVDFAETFMHVSKGVRAGQPLILTDWQVALLDGLYERRDDGLLRYRRSLIGLARKNGKSLLGTVVALVGLIEGEPGAEVYSAAGDRQQARVVFNEAKWQIMQSPALSGVCKVYRDVVEVPSTGAIYRVLSSDAKLQQGLNPSTVVFDELHVQGSNSDLWDALTLGSGARKDPMIVSITTAGFDLDTVCGRLYNYGKEIVAGTKLDERFGFWWWEAPADCEISDRDAWAIANPNLAEGLLDIEDMEISMMQTAETAMRRYRLNQWVRTDGESWLPKGAWELCRSDDELDPTVPVFVGIDMALKHDSIA
ncbi:MAG: terminase large subunit, partial [Caulobacteraceae bacterium]|nr:terminase large subunit [Caulobacteraceae bacterium]